MSSNNKQITLKDIASATGFSVNTVSRALRGKKDIGKETTEKIKRVASEMGYVNNMIASSLRLGYTNLRLGPAVTEVVQMGSSHSGTIAVILGDVSRNECGIMMREIEQHARFLGYSCFLYNTNDNDLLEREAIRMALHKGVEGIVLRSGSHEVDNIRLLKTQDLPFVLLGKKNPAVDADYVVCNEKMCGYAPAQHLISYGHKEILMIASASCPTERIEGYRRAHQDAGIAVNKGLIRSVVLDDSDCFDVVTEMIAGSVPFSAVMASDDVVAWRIWLELTKLGKKIPEDYSLASCEYVHSHILPPTSITSMNCFHEKMSVAAVDILAGKMRSGKREMSQVAVDPQIIYGDTVAMLH